MQLQNELFCHFCFYDLSKDSHSLYSHQVSLFSFALVALKKPADFTLFVIDTTCLEKTH